MGLTRLKKRADFVRVAGARVFVKTQTVIVQCCYAEKEKCLPVGLRVGFTASKRVGNAVRRNLSKRRLRAWVDKNLEAKIPVPLMGSCDFVFIALVSTGDADFGKLSGDLSYAVDRCLRQVRLKISPDT